MVVTFVGRGGELVSGVGLEVGGLNAMLWGLCLGGVFMFVYG